MDQEYRGMVVEDDRGRVGTVVGVDNDPAIGATQLVVQWQDGSQQALTSEMFSVRSNVVRVNESTASVYSGASAGRSFATQPLAATSEELEVAPGEEVRIPLIREELAISTRKVERGGVRVHKLVNERTETIEQPTAHDYVDVERITVGRVVEGEAVPRVREEGNTLIIPILEEMLVVEKRLVLKEEVRITKRRTEELEQVQVVLREEEIQIEQIEDVPSVSNDIRATL
jgi:uncharacterized protein (TIGR02271 family)